MTVYREQNEEPESKYRILAGLGEGGTANVLLALARGPAGFSKLVVLKALKPHLGEDSDLCNMFLNEARLAARLNHPNVVQTYEVVEEKGLPLIVMEYLEGQPLSRLRSRAKGDGVPLQIQLKIIADALEGLHYAHELADFDGTPLGVVHRDVTPHNVFVTFDGQVKILDFGIAKIATSMVETQTGVIKGKIRYMPPEQIAGEAIDRRTDVFAVGVMLWEAATGTKMWKDVPDATILHRVVNGEIPPPSSINPNVPASLERLCMKALSVDPSARHATAIELQGEIEAVLRELGEPVNNKHIGQYVSRMFEDDRRSTKMLIETRVSKVASLTWEEYRALEGHTLATSVTLSREGRSGSHSSRQSRPGQATTDPSGPRRRKKRGWVMAIATGAALAAALLAVRRHRQIRTIAQRGDSSAAAPAPVTPPRADPTPDLSATSPAKPDFIEVRLTALPKEASLFLDDTALPTNPLVQHMPADGTQHVVRATAPGYAPRTAILVLEKDTDVTITLERLRASSSSKARGWTSTAPPHTPIAKAPAPASTPAKDCDPPYSIDAQGIKRIKLECM